MSYLKEHTNGDNISRTEQAIMRYKDTVYGIAVTQLRSKHDADDAFQEVFMTYLAKAPQFESAEHEKAWLIRTTINMCKRFSSLPRWVSLEALGDHSEVIRLDTEEQQRVYAEVTSMPEKYRLPIYLHYFEGMPTAQCADVLRISEAALRKRLSRGREILRKRLESDAYETDLQSNKGTAYP